MRKITKRSAAIIAAAVVGVGALGGVAMANGWLVGGKGYATASGAKVSDMRADVTLDKNIYPEVSLTATALVDNPNEFNVELTGIKNPAVTASRGGAANPGCVTALNNLGLAAVTPTLPGTAPIIAKQSTDKTVSLPLTIAKEFPLACQDSIINLTFDFEGTSTVKAANV
ncbi:hypothetical protein [Actinoplanes friuliensis]|uniref:Uncharacterized protein n=1 Tax=Actinoplanes friuliensis DSM 7358 TaxID=1246995 RepID=U5WAE0_9ACTN|nr:hypothetical protein [Actinoplanes friuliensis]AGZ45992.1 hypothetical protein AFR_38690 [Actinoplanes friuliensis DSM 7358]